MFCDFCVDCRVLNRSVGANYSQVRFEPRVGTSAADAGHRSAAGRLSGHRTDPQVHQGSARRDRAQGGRPGVGRRDAARQSPHGQPHRDHSWRDERSTGDHRPLRHEALSRVPVRRRERRRLERGVPHRAGPRPQGAPQPDDDRARLPRRRGSRDRVARQRPHVRQPALRGRREARPARSTRSRRWCSST